MANKYFTPLDTFGTQTFQQAGQPAGWYQFQVDVPVVPTIPIVLRDIAQGVLIQAISEVRYCLSPAAAAAGTTAYLSLPAGTTLFLSGAQALRQFCILLPAAGAEFVVQIYTGNIGPVPLIHQVSTGGVIPPPPPGSAALFTTNTLHVMAAPYGNDATGTRNRLDLPFASCAAAEAAASSGDTIMVWNGTFEVADLGTKTLFYVLNGAVLTSSTSSVFTISGQVIDVSGSGLITCQSGSIAVSLTNSARFTNNGIDVESTGLGFSIGNSTVDGRFDIRSQGVGVDVNGATGTVLLFGNVTSNGNIAINLTNQHDIVVYGNVTSNGTGTAAISTGASGSVYVNGNVTSSSGDAIINEFSTVTVYGSVISPVAHGVVNTDGLVTVYGSITAATNAVRTDNSAEVNVTGNIISGTTAVRMLSAGLVNITGNITADAIGVDAEGGTLNITGNILTTTGDGVNLVGTVANITGNITAANDGSSAGRGLFMSDQSVVMLRGDAVGKGTGNGITCVDSILTHYGDAITEGVNSGISIQQKSTVKLYGNQRGGSSGGGVRVFQAANGRADLYGTCESSYAGLFVQDSPGYEVHVHGTALGGSVGAITLESGTVYVYGLAKALVGGGTVGIRISGVASLLYLMGGARVERDGAGNSISSFAPTGQALTFTSYVASGNTAQEGTLTVAGVYNVIV